MKSNSYHDNSPLCLISGEAVEFYEAYDKQSMALPHRDAPDWTICLRVQSGREKWLMTVLGSAWREVTLCSCVRSIWSCGEPGPSHVTPLPACPNCRHYLQSKDPHGLIMHCCQTTMRASLEISSDLSPGLKHCVFILLIPSDGCFDESTARPEHRS